MSKQIKVTEANRQKIMAELKSVEKRCKARLATFADVLNAVELAESNPVLAILPKKDWIGATATYHPGHGGGIANSYNGVPEETKIEIIRRASGWFFVTSYRRSCAHSARSNVTVTRAMADEALDRFLQSVSVTA